MPGIAGVISQRPPHECESLMKGMVASMQHEAFSTSGIHSVPELGVYGGWVAHERSFAADQVFSNERSDVSLILSGECFVDPEASAELKKRGHHLGETAGTWLTHLYEEEGEEFFTNLNGLFSGLLIDKRQKNAFLFNDRYGVERIYWHQGEDAFYFASEAKALLRILPELRAFDDRGVAQFLTFGCTLELQTLFRGVQLLAGGSVWCFENGNCQRRKYFSPGIWESQSPLAVDTFQAELDKTFKRILPRYFRSSSRIGISLTGGLDTRMIMAGHPPSEKLICYTFDGEKGRTLDARLAARIANACSLEHRTLRIGHDFFSDFPSLADRTVYITDGTFGVLGTHEIYLNAQARQLAPVRLTGNFGSEVLRGSSTFKPLSLSMQLFAPEFRPPVASAAESQIRDNQHAVTFAAFREIPWHLFGRLAAGRSQVTFRTPYLDNELVALAYRLPESLKKSPLPASRFIQSNSTTLSEIPTDRGIARDNSGLAFLCRRLFAEVTFKLDYYNSEGLPHSLSRLDPLLRGVSSAFGVLELHKYLPYYHWLRRELAGYVEDRLAAARSRQMPFWNSDFVKRMADDHIRGRNNYAREIEAVLTLEAVERLLLRGSFE